MLAACSSDNGTDPGSGTGTLLVEGHVSYDSETGSADVSVRVQRAGTPVTDAVVKLQSDKGNATLTLDQNGQYHGLQPGWASYYAINVSSGSDRLDGSIEAPDQVVVTSPDPTMAIDPHTAPNGVVTLKWSGSPAMQIHVKTKDFEFQGADAGHIDVPASNFQDTSQELEITRQNSTPLAGGAPGSTLSASYRLKTTMIVVNPF
jgi:hypothetical protein